jgi:peroxiredoxin Q/BCP
MSTRKIIFWAGVISMSLFSIFSQASELKIGEIAPDFNMISHKGEALSLSQFKNKKIVVLYFYPKDDTPGCTAQACAFRDSYEDFKKAGAEVIGVSSDKENSHDTFAEKHRLPFHLISDPKGELRKAYKVGSTLGLIPGRVTFVIDIKGVIQHVFSSQMQATKHIDEALKVIKRLKNQD